MPSVRTTPRAALDGPSGMLAEALERVRRQPALRVAARRLADDAGRVDADLSATVLAQIPAYTQSRNPDVLAQLARHGPQHTAEIVRLLDGGPVGDFGFVREHARLRASQHFPLESVLHAYRCGHKVFARRLRDAALASAEPGPGSAEATQSLVAALADFALEYTDTISTIVSGEYVEQTRRLTTAASDHRAELLGILLDGHDESDGRVARVLRQAGYLDGRQAFCVVLAQSVDPADMLDIERARRLVDAIDALVAPATARRVIDLRANTVTAVFSAVRRVSGWTPPATPLSRRIARDLAVAGNGVLIGVSDDVSTTARIAGAHRRAQIALRLAHVDERVLEFDRITLRRLMLHLGGADLVALLPAWTGVLRDADHRLDGALVATLRGYADANLNTLKTAARLGVHPNTVYARFERIRALTGIDPRSYHGLGELLVAMDAAGRAAPSDARWR